MRYLATGLAALLLIAGAAGAQERAATRFGEIAVAGPASSGDYAGMGQELRFAGRPVPGVSGMWLDIDGVWSVGEADLAVVHVGSGGNDACANHRRIVSVTARGAEAGTAFGQCGTELLAVRVAGPRLELDLRMTDPRLDHVTYVVFRGRVVEVPVPRVEAAVPAAGGGPAVTRWAGRHPYDLLEDAGERQRLLSVLPLPKLYELEERMAVSTEMVLDGGWLIGIGCMAHNCGFEMGGFAIEVATGRVQVAIRHESAAPEVFGGRRGSLHPALERFLRDGELL